MLNHITTQQYNDNEIYYSNQLHEAYKAADVLKNKILKSSILSKWLDLSNFTNKEALADNNKNFIYILANDLEPSLKRQRLLNWIDQYQYDSSLIIMHVYAILETVDSYNTNSTKHLNQVNDYINPNPRIEKLFLPEDRLLVEIINTYIWSNIQNFFKLDFEQEMSKSLNGVLANINYDLIDKSDGAKLMMLIPYLQKQASNKLIKTYLPRNYNSILEIAKTLNLETNPDFWIQSVDTQNNNSLVTIYGDTVILNYQL